MTLFVFVNNDSPVTLGLFIDTNHWKFDGILASLYLNGEYDLSYQSYAPCSGNYTYNLIGAGNLVSDDLDADIDELKIFSRDLTKSEIQFEMNNDMYN